MKGYAFEGFTQNDRMPNYINGNICVLDTRNNIEFTKFQITNSDELKKITELEKEHKKSIINKLMESNIKCVFYSDTNPEFESMLTEKGIMGIVVYKREILDNICKSLNIQSSVEDLHIGTGIVEYKDYIKIFSENSQIDTLLLHGSTRQVLEETSRAIDDVIRLLKVDNKSVTGAGAIEIELSLHLEKLSKEIGGKEQLAILKFAEALESIPMIIAENCGLDSIEIVTLLKTLHSNGKKDFGIDLINGVSDAKERNIIEPIELKMHAISSSTDVANLIIKLDDVYKG
jgi:chaperonin GroEL (HSP60 family)